MGHNGHRTRINLCQFLHLLKKKQGRHFNGLVVGIGHDENAKPVLRQNRRQVIPDDAGIIQTMNQNHPVPGETFCRRGGVLKKSDPLPLCQFPGRRWKPVFHCLVTPMPDSVFKRQNKAAAHLENDKQGNHQGCCCPLFMIM
jgi:hypothetical protein